MECIVVENVMEYVLESVVGTKMQQMWAKKGQGGAKTPKLEPRWG